MATIGAIGELYNVSGQRMSLGLVHIERQP